MYITITGSQYYLGIDKYKIGEILYLKKDPDNIYDSEAIKIMTDKDVKCGYVANSVNTVAKGTHSAGFIYDQIKDKTKCKVLFVVEEYAIAELI